MVVCDNCTQQDKDRLEKIQIEAARLVTGTSIYITLQKLYREIGWLTLENRRTYQKIILAFKIKNTIVPEYFSSLFSRTTNESKNY